MRSTQRTQALAAGISLIIMSLSAFFSYGYVLSGIEVPGNPATTFEQLISSAILFKLSLGGWLLIFFTDIIVAVSLYLFFREPHRNISLATALLRLAYTLVLGIALIRLMSVVPLLNNPGISKEMAGNQVLSFLQSFDRIWSMGLIVFGLHLLGLGYLSIRSRSTPGVLGYLLLFAGLGYIVLNTSKTLIGLDKEVVSMLEKILMVPMALGEILLAFWLILRGGKSKYYYL